MYLKKFFIVTSECTKKKKKKESGLKLKKYVGIGHIISIKYIFRFIDFISCKIQITMYKIQIP